MFGDMPEIDTTAAKAAVDQKFHWVVDAICSRRSGCVRLRASKPDNGVAAYVWRNVAFSISPKPAHHCMPTTADFGIKDADFAHRTETYNRTDVSDIQNWNQSRMDNWAKREAFIRQELNPIVDAIVNIVPKEQWHGVSRWKKAMLG